MSDTMESWRKFRAAWREEEGVRRRFAADPRAVFAEFGMPAPPADARIEVVGEDDCIFRVAFPPGADAPLTDGELEGVSGGTRHPAHADFLSERQWMEFVHDGHVSLAEASASLGHHG